jgi:hypothetical protein
MLNYETFRALLAVDSELERLAQTFLRYRDTLLNSLEHTELV